MKNKVFLLIIFILSIFTRINVVKGSDIISYTSSGSGTSATGKGRWNEVSGFRVVILDQNGNIVPGTKRINIINEKVSSVNDAWPNTKITSNSYSKVEYIRKGVVNSRTNFNKAISQSNVYYWDGITGLGNFGNYLGNKEGIKVSGVDNYLSKNNYKNLKLMMEAAGYTCYKSNPDPTQCENSENHYVSVEPLTLIDRDLGTAFELAGYKWGACTQTSYTGHCWYFTTFINMHNSLYVDENKRFFGDSILGGNAEVSDSPRKSAYDAINSNRGVGLGIYKITEIGELTPTKGYLKIIKKNNYGGNASGNFIVYQGKGCNTGARQEFNGTININKTLTLVPGWYSITEVSAPSLYVQPENNCIDVEVKEAQTLSKTFTNTLQCHEAVTYINGNFSGDEKKRQLIDLYNKEENSSFTNLLNFDTPSCSSAPCSLAAKDDDGCLNAEFKPNTSFGPDNYSCFTNTINVDGKTAFCQTSLDIESYVGRGPFKTTAGQMYINSSTGKAVKSELSMNCYLLDSTKSSFTVDYKDYIETIKFDNKALFFNNTSIKLDKVGASNLYQKKVNVDYYFNKIYSNNITGEVVETKPNVTDSPCSDCKFLGYGKISKLTDPSAIFPKFSFALKLEDNEYNFDGICYVRIDRGIIEETPKLVFRTINTQVSDGKKAFLDKKGSVRQAKTNWLGKENIITSTNNSYNKDGKIPKYTILLTPETIRKIRDYNKEPGNSYDDYKFTCKPTSVGGIKDGGNVCISEYLTKLSELTIQDGKKAVVINNSKIRDCFTGTNKNKDVCDLK